MSQRWLAVLVITCIAGSAAGGTGAGQTTGPTSGRPAETVPGLAVTSISVPAGTVRVSLPDDMAAGDTISGTVVAEPRGRNEAERAGNGAALEGYVVDAGPKKATVGQRLLTFVVPVAAAAILIVRDPRGKEVGRSSIPLRAQQPGLGRPPQPQDFRFPQVAVAGQPLEIRGPFGGDASNTKVTVGEQPAQVLAESPRKAIVAAPPSSVPGPSTYRLVENGLAVTAPCNVLSVQLTAPKTSLTRGERTTVHVAVSGLDGIREPVILKLVNRTPTVIALEGGAVQVLPIRPGDVASGTYATDRQVTGIGGGAFTITSALDDQTPPSSVNGTSAQTATPGPAVRPTTQGLSFAAARMPRMPPPARFAEIQLPAAGAFAFGTVHIKAAATDPRIEVRAARFFYRRPNAPARTLIGVDRNGDDGLLNTFAPGPTGDGWSAYWDTRRVANGTYEISADLDTSAGTLTARELVLVDQTPPIPHIRRPAFGANVEGDVPIFADRAPGKSAKVDIKPQLATISLPADPTNQHNYPYDGKKGAMMCDPASEAAIFWQYQVVRDYFRGLANCKGKTGAALDACAKDLLVHTLAQYKGTGKTGTRYDNEVAGAKAFLKFLGLDKWNIIMAEYKTKAMSFKDLKFQASNADGGKEVKGLIIHAQPVGHPNATGHAMAVTSIDDEKDKDGKHKVCVMDPDTGSEVCLKMDDDGVFEYPPGSGKNYNVDSTSKIVGPPSDKLAMRAPFDVAYETSGWRDVLAPTGLPVDSSTGWTTIARLNGPASTWRTTWHASGLHGFYWIRVTVTDAHGNSGSDAVEVKLP